MEGEKEGGRKSRVTDGKKQRKRYRKIEKRKREV